MSRSRIQRSARAGFSLLETVVGLSALIVALGALAGTLERVNRASHSAQSESSLQIDSQRALLEIASELRRSGVVVFDDGQFPYIFDGGEPDAGLEHHAHPLPESNAAPADDDFGPSREIVFLLPADEDADGHPDIDVDGWLSWDLDQISYVLVPRAGRNVLERRVNGLAPQTIAYDVERVQFDTAESSGWEIPLGCVRIRLWFRRTDESGELHQWSTETLVALNTTEAF